MTVPGGLQHTYRPGEFFLPPYSPSLYVPMMKTFQDTLIFLPRSNQSAVLIVINVILAGCKFILWPGDCLPPWKLALAYTYMDGRLVAAVKRAKLCMLLMSVRLIWLARRAEHVTVTLRRGRRWEELNKSSLHRKYRGKRLFAKCEEEE